MANRSTSSRVADMGAANRRLCSSGAKPARKLKSSNPDEDET